MCYISSQFSIKSNTNMIFELITQEFQLLKNGVLIRAPTNAIKLVTVSAQSPLAAQTKITRRYAGGGGEGGMRPAKRINKSIS